MIRVSPSSADGAKGVSAVVAIADGLPRPKWRGLLHSWSLVFSVPAVVALLYKASSLLALVSLSIYSFSLLAVFGSSAAYHRLARSDLAQLRMRRLDHLMIYLQIAGTYTPVCLLAVANPAGLYLLAVSWAGATLGIGFKLFANLKVARWSNGLYVLLGWVSVLGIRPISAGLAPNALGFLIAGGLLYTVGAVVFALRRPDPFPLVFGFHEIWHVFTVLAAACHFAMVWLVAGGAPSI